MSGVAGRGARDAVSMRTRIRTALEVAAVRGGDFGTLWLLAPVSLLAAVFLMLATFASPAQAALTHKFKTSITQTEPFEPFTAPWGVALDSAGNLFVADPEGHALDAFNSLNAFVAHVGAGELSSGFDRGVAVSNATGDVYVSNSEPDELQVFEPNVPGEPAKGYKSLSPWTGTGTAGGSFGGSCCFTYVAVNNSGDEHAGDVYLLSASPTSTLGHTLYVVKPGPSGEEGETVQELSMPGAGNEDGLAVSPITGDVYVASPETGAVDVFNVNGEPQSELTGAGTPGPNPFRPIDVAIDPTSGEIYAVDAGNHVVDEFNSAGKYLGQITNTEPAEPLVNPLGVTVNASGDVYVSDGGAKAFDVYGAGEEEPLAPTVTEAAASGVTATEATLHAEINPNGLAATFDTTYRFEYGTSTAYGTNVPVPDADIGAGEATVAVSQHVTGLSPNTTYHWRVAATNKNGTNTSVDHTFVYETSGGGLPDNRAYEMVTPPTKNAALIGHTSFLGNPDDISEDGSRVIADSIQCFAGAESCTADRDTAEGSPYAFTRTGGNWVATALSPPSQQDSAASIWGFSANAATALFSMPTPPQGEDDWYVREPDGSFLDIGPITQNGAPAFGEHGLILRTADSSHVVYALTRDQFWPFDLSKGEESVYESTGTGDTAPVLVGVSGRVGSTDLISVCGTLIAGVYNDISADGSTVYFIAAGPCSPGGTGTNAEKKVPANTLYARVGESETIKISERSPLDCREAACQSSPPGDAAFQGASADGSKVFFTSTQQLTDDASEDSHSGDTATSSGCSATTGANGCNLYEGELEKEAGTGKTVLKRLAAVSAGDISGHGPRVQGVMAISSDGSHVYFVAKGVLSTAANSQGLAAQDGQENLYLFERDANHPEGQTAFIATLSAANFGASGSDSKEWEEGVGVANVTPDGRFLVFTSQAQLTSDDTSSTGATQVFRYDAQSAQLVRVSIGENGFDDNGNRFCGTSTCPDAASIRSSPSRPDGTMSDDGAYVFFQSPVGLTSQALNEVQIRTHESGEPVYAQNVYEYHDGHVYLISDGRDVEEFDGASDVQLLGSDASGANVFFTTSNQLVPQDTDTQQDIYDARICTGQDPCIKPAPPLLPPCLGEACHGTPSVTPLVPSAPTVTFNGAGNLTVPMSEPAVKPKSLTRAQKLAKALKACRSKRNKRKRAVCESQVHKKYGPSHAARKTNRRGK